MINQRISRVHLYMRLINLWRHIINGLYITVQYTTTQYVAMQYSALHYNVVQCSAIQCSIVRTVISVVQFNSVKPPGTQLNNMYNQDIGNFQSANNLKPSIICIRNSQITHNNRKKTHITLVTIVHTVVLNYAIVCHTST